MPEVLRKYSYFGTGGTCLELVVPSSGEQARVTMQRLWQQGRPYFILGGGTNSLVSDEHWEGAALVLSELKELRAHGNVIHAGAGVDNTDLANFALSLGLSGAEFMNRLPGRIGGTVRMNAKCYGGEMSQIVQKVATVSPDGKHHDWRGKDVFRGYKDTNFMTNGHLVVGCEIVLQAGNAVDIAAKMQHCENDRMGKHQFDFPSCGCVFKNDYSVGVPSGVLLHHSGAKKLSRLLKTTMIVPYGQL